MKKVVYIAMNNGYGGVIMCNLFAFKETKPEHMKDAARTKLEKENVDVAFQHICGIENDAKMMDAAIPVEDVVFAYGTIAVTGWKDKRLLKMAQMKAAFLIECMKKEKKNVFAFKLTEENIPAHPRVVDTTIKKDEWKRFDEFIKVPWWN